MLSFTWKTLRAWRFERKMVKNARLRSWCRVFFIWPRLSNDKMRRYWGFWYVKTEFKMNDPECGISRRLYLSVSEYAALRLEGKL